MATLQIHLSRANKAYTSGEMVRGYVEIDTKKAVSHNGLKLSVESIVTMQYANSNHITMWEAMQSTLKPVTLIDFTVQLLKPGKLPADKTHIPFEFKLESTSGQKLHETYHGVYISVRYRIHATLARKLFSSDIKKTLEFVVQVPGQGFSPEDLKDTSAKFEMAPEKLENVKATLKDTVPNYRLTGRLDRTSLDISEAFTGSLRVIETQKPIRSIELQLVRVESCNTGDRSIKEPTEIQNLQIAEGNVVDNLDIPIYMVPPRLFSCPTLVSKSYAVEFEVNIIILFRGGHQVTENFPIHFYRYPEGFERQHRPAVE